MSLQIETPPRAPERASGDAEVLRRDGVVVLRGLLDAEAELRRVREAYERLVDALGRVFLAEAGSGHADGFADRPFAERFAVALGASGGALLDHLDPPLRVGAPDYRFREDLPPAQIPELFELIRAPRLLDVLETVLGREIEVSPAYHLTFKLSRRHLELARRVAEECGRPFLRPATFDHFHVLETGWHMDAPYALRDAHESDIAIAWIPLTAARRESAALCVVPGSHRHGIRRGPFSDEELARKVALEVEPGDVILMDNRILHSSTDNATEDGFRWAFSFRYLPAGQATGRPFLPGFVARSRSRPDRELASGALWTGIWTAALRHVARGAAIPDPAATSLAEAAALTRSWSERVRTPEDWLALGLAEPALAAGFLGRLRARLSRRARRS